MIASSAHQDWLFYSPLAQQAARLKDDLLDPGPPGPETYRPPEPIGLGQVAGKAVNRQLQLTPPVHSSPRIYYPQATNFLESEFRNSL